MNNQELYEWILCPVCGGKTRNKIRSDTILINFPIYCPKCKQENLIEVRNLDVFSVKISQNAK